MPFFAYQLSSRTDGHPLYHLEQKVSLAGRNGPFAQHAVDLNPNKSVPFTWHTTERDLLTRLSLPPDGHAVVIDLKPGVKRNVSLFRLTEVWGYSYGEWTPILLNLTALYVDREEEDPKSFKESFRHPEGETAQVHEFLYLQGGVLGGSWNWGMVGRVNGALLWPDALTFFLSVIRPSRITHDVGDANPVTVR